MIQCRLSWLRLDKQAKEDRKLPYHIIAEETGLSTGVLVRLMNSNFERVDTSTIERLCKYFGCQVGDLLIYVPEGARAEESGE